MARLVVHQDVTTAVAGRDGDVAIRHTDADGEQHLYSFSVAGTEKFIEMLQQGKQQALGLVKVEGS